MKYIIEVIIHVAGVLIQLHYVNEMQRREDRMKELNSIRKDHNSFCNQLRSNL